MRAFFFLGSFREKSKGEVWRGKRSEWRIQGQDEDILHEKEKASHLLMVLGYLAAEG